MIPNSSISTALSYFFCIELIFSFRKAERRAVMNLEVFLMRQKSGKKRLLKNLKIPLVMTTLQRLRSRSRRPHPGSAKPQLSRLVKPNGDEQKSLKVKVRKRSLVIRKTLAGSKGMMMVVVVVMLRKQRALRKNRRTAAIGVMMMTMTNLWLRCPQGQRRALVGLPQLELDLLLRLFLSPLMRS